MLKAVPNRNAGFIILFTSIFILFYFMRSLSMSFYFIIKTSSRFNGFYLCSWFLSLFSFIWIGGQFPVDKSCLLEQLMLPGPVFVRLVPPGGPPVSGVFPLVACQTHQPLHGSGQPRPPGHVLPILFRAGAHDGLRHRHKPRKLLIRGNAYSGPRAPAFSAFLVLSMREGGARGQVCLRSEWRRLRG